MGVLGRMEDKGGDTTWNRGEREPGLKRGQPTAGYDVEKEVVGKNRDNGAKASQPVGKGGREREKRKVVQRNEMKDGRKERTTKTSNASTKDASVQ